MTTITIQKASSHLQKTNFVDTTELLYYLLSISSSEIEYEEVSPGEEIQLNNIPGMKEFKNTVANLKL